MEENLNQEEKNQEYKVNLRQLCKALNKLTGGSVADYTGYFPIAYTILDSCQPIFRNDENLEFETREEFIKNSFLRFRFDLKRECIVPKRHRVVKNSKGIPVDLYKKNPYPSYILDCPVYLSDAMENGRHLSDYILPTSEEIAEIQAESIREGTGHINVDFDKNRLDIRGLTVTIRESDITGGEQSRISNKEQDLLRMAISVAQKEASKGGGKGE